MGPPYCCKDTSQQLTMTPPLWMVAYACMGKQGWHGRALGAQLSCRPFDTRRTGLRSPMLLLNMSRQALQAHCTALSFGRKQPLRARTPWSVEGRAPYSYRVGSLLEASTGA